MKVREERLFKVLVDIWYDVSGVTEVTEGIFEATIPRNRIDMNNLIQLQGRLIWEHPEISLNWVKPMEIKLVLNYPPYE